MRDSRYDVPAGSQYRVVDHLSRHLENFGLVLSASDLAFPVEAGCAVHHSELDRAAESLLSTVVQSRSLCARFLFPRLIAVRWLRVLI